MRQLKILAGAQHSEQLLSVLEAEDIDYVVIRDVGTGPDQSDEVLVEFPLPDQAVEYIMDELDEAGLADEYVVTLAAESARTRGFDELEDRFIRGTEEGDSISPEELRTTALNLHPDPLPYYAMTIISALVAVAGLLVDSAALVVGAMVIAPQVGSALTASVGATIGDWELLTRGLRAQVLSLLLAIVGAVVFGEALQALGFVSPTVDIETIAQIGERTAPGLLTLSVGVAAGTAGALGLATALPVSIVGVMIAAALLPAAAATGIGLAWNTPSVAVGAAVLLVANLVSINAAGFATLRLFGYRSSDTDTARLPTVGAAAIALALLGAIVLSGAMFTAQASFENDVNSAVSDVLADEAYEELELAQTRTDFLAIPGSDTSTIHVVVHRPVGKPYPRLATELAATISEMTDRAVTVQVEFVDSQQSSTSALKTHHTRVLG